MTRRSPYDRRLRRINGQVLGIERMIAAGRPCGDVLIQIAAAQAALREVALRVLACHTHDALTAVAATTASPDEAAAGINTLVALLTRTGGHPSPTAPARGADLAPRG